MNKTYQNNEQGAHPTRFVKYKKLVSIYIKNITNTVRI